MSQLEQLDLNINNYTIKDIESFFKLKKYIDYTQSDIELREYEIREQLLQSGQIDKRFKADLLDFLTTAKEWLIIVKCKKSSDTDIPTVIPKNYKLDTMDLPTIEKIPTRENELVKRTDTTFLYTSPSDYLPGILNPLNTRVITKCINIDTRYRDNIYATQCSDFVLQLPMRLTKVVSMQLAALEFPVTFYGISSYYGNNFLYLAVEYIKIDESVPSNLTGETLTVEKTFIIPDGNYNAVDFIDCLNHLLSPKNIEGEFVEPYCIFSYIHFKLDISTSGSGSGKVTIDTHCEYRANIKEIKMDFTRDIHGNPDSIKLSSKIGWNLGFIRPKYSGAYCYTAETIIEPSTIRYIYLAVDDFTTSSNNHFISVFNNSFFSPDILARISIKGSYFSLLMENDYTIISEPRNYFGPVDIQKLRIRLFDENGRILSMNHSNFSFCLNLKLLYDP